VGRDPHGRRTRGRYKPRTLRRRRGGKKKNLHRGKYCLVRGGAESRGGGGGKGRVRGSRKAPVGTSEINETREKKKKEEAKKKKSGQTTSETKRTEREEGGNTRACETGGATK